MRVLAVYGSKRGGSAGLAEMIGDALISPPVRQVAKLVTTLGARGHETFGGRLQPDAKGFPASAMAKKVSGDWRDPDHVGEFAAVVARSLGVPIALAAEYEVGRSCG